MPLTLVHSKWDSGALVFHDADDFGVGAEILRIAQDDLAIGTSTNDVTVTLYGDVTLDGDLTLTTEDVSVSQGKYIYLEGQDSTTYLRADAVGYLMANALTGVNLAIGGTDVVTVAAALITLVQPVSCSSTLGVSGTTTAVAINASGALNVTLVTDAESSITGAIKTAGGIGVAKALWVGTTANVAGAVTLQSTLAVSDETTITLSGAQTGGVDGLYSFITASGTAGWTGSVDAVRGRTTISDTGQIGNAYGGWFGVKFTSTQGTGAGLTCGIYAEAASDKTSGGQPSAVAYFQSVGNTSVDLSNQPILVLTSATGGTKSNYAFSLGFAPAATTVSSGSATNILYQQTIHIMANGSDAYIPYSTVAGTFTTAYPVAINKATDGFTVTNSALAVDGRAAKFSGTSATPAMSDGYGAVEIDMTISGTATGWFSPLSSWINITGSGVAGAGGFMCAQTNGVYADSGANTGSTIIFGMRASAILTDAPTRLCPFSLNTSNRSITALFDIASGPAIGLVNGSPVAAADGTIPIVVDAGGTIRYIHVYGSTG